MAEIVEPLQVRIARKSFPAVGDRDELTVLKNVSFDVAPRSFVVMTGPSGCGKSTLLNIIAGLDKDFEGSIKLGHGDPKLAFIFQAPRLLPWRTVKENIALALPTGDPRHALIPEMLQRVGLEEAANAYPERISLGMQRRAALFQQGSQCPDQPPIRIHRDEFWTSPSAYCKRGGITRLVMPTSPSRCI